MKEPKSAATLAWLAAEALNSLNHATLMTPNPSLEAPADAYATVAGLRSAVASLPQTLAQIEQLLDELRRADRIQHASGDDHELADAVAEFKADLTLAGDASRVVRDALSGALLTLASVGQKAGDKA